MSYIPNNDRQEPTSVYFDSDDLARAKIIKKHIDDRVTKVMKGIDGRTQRKDIEKKYERELKKLGGRLESFRKVTTEKVTKEMREVSVRYYNERFRHLIYNNSVFDKYEFAKTYQSAHAKEYFDELKPFKDELTKIINTEFLRSDRSQILLMRTVFKRFKPWLKKYDYKLIFYGGNLMRSISNNIRRYLDPYTDEIINKIFLMFVQKSDNDFSLLMKKTNFDNSKILTEEEYDKNFNRAYIETIDIMNDIRDELEENLEDHFEYFRYGKKHKKRILAQALTGLNGIDLEYKFENLRLSPRHDQILLLGTAEEMKLDEMKPDTSEKLSLFINRSKGSILFCSYNNALEYIPQDGGFAKFALQRIKFNFESDVDAMFNGVPYLLDLNVSGEVIDVGINHLYKDAMWKDMGAKELIKFSNDMTHELHNDEYDFDYTVYNLHYQVQLMMMIIYEKMKYPWDDAKYNKRLARIIYYEFFRLLDMFPISSGSLRKIRDKFLTMDSRFLKQMKESNEEMVKKIGDEPKDKQKGLKKKYNSYIKDLKFYLDKMNKIVNSIIIFFEGGRKLNINHVFDINVN